MMFSHIRTFLELGSCTNDKIDYKVFYMGNPKKCHQYFESAVYKDTLNNAYSNELVIEWYKWYVFSSKLKYSRYRYCMYSSIQNQSKNSYR